jgi:hypothetical protein
MIAAPRHTVSRAIATAFNTPLPRHPLYLVADGLVPIMLALAVVILPPHLGRDRVGTVKPTAPLANASAVLKDVVPPNARFATQRDFPREYPKLTQRPQDFRRRRNGSIKILVRVRQRKKPRFKL